MSLNANQLQSLGGSRQLLELESVVKVSGGLFSALLFCSIKGYYSYSNVTQVKKDVYIFLIFACVSPWGKYTYIIQQSRHQWLLLYQCLDFGLKGRDNERKYATVFLKFSGNPGQNSFIFDTNTHKIIQSITLTQLYHWC